MCNEKPVIAMDIGGVLMEVDPLRTLGVFGFTGLSQVSKELLYNIELFECGKISAGDFCKICRQTIDPELSDAQIIANWNCSLGEPDKFMEGVVRRLVECGYRIVLFSDTSEPHMNYICRKHPYIHLATGAVLSYETGAKKPADPMYERFERDYAVPVLYIDDREENIAAAESRNWPCRRFISADDLASWDIENIPRWRYICSGI